MKPGWVLASMNSSVTYTLNKLGASIMGKKDQIFPDCLKRNLKPGDVVKDNVWGLADDFGETCSIGSEHPILRGHFELQILDGVPAPYGEIEVDGKKYIDVEFQGSRHACCPVSEDGYSVFVDGRWLNLP